MRHCHRLLLVASVAFGIAGCSTLMVGSQIEHGLNFTRFRTFDWGPADSLPTGDPRLDRDAYFIDYLQGAVEKQMAAKGYVLLESGQPDLLIHYHASTQRRLDINAADRGRGYCQTADCRVGVAEYEAGTLIIDIVDARTNQLIWRGWAQDSLDGVLGNPDRLASAAEKGVDGMFVRFPAAR